MYIKNLYANHLNLYMFIQIYHRTTPNKRISRLPESLLFNNKRIPTTNHGSTRGVLGWVTPYPLLNWKVRNPPYSHLLPSVVVSSQQHVSNLTPTGNRFLESTWKYVTVVRRTGRKSLLGTGSHLPRYCLLLNLLTK